MRSKFSAYFMLLSVVIMFASCLKDKDENITYRGDSAITAFSVVTAKRYAHTISKSGADSVYRANVSCSNYKFYIDQIACEIYNPDSLPKGVDLKKLICSITSRNSGCTQYALPLRCARGWCTCVGLPDFMITS